MRAQETSARLGRLSLAVQQVEAAEIIKPMDLSAFYSKRNVQTHLSTASALTLARVSHQKFARCRSAG